MWEKFFNPPKILATLGICAKTGDVAEFGCGYGTFTIPAAKVIHGKLFAFDIDPEMVLCTKREAGKLRVSNIEVFLRDFLTDGTGLDPESIDYAMLFNILHLEEPVSLLLEAYRVLKKGGQVGIIHWNYDTSTPRGPSMNIRPKPEDCIEWAGKAGFVEPRRFDLKPYHYGIVLSKS
jgi:SAM-dependent methyltransferase